MVKAHCAVDRDEVLIEPFLPVAEAEFLSDAIVAYVAKTGQHLVLNDAAREDDLHYSGSGRYCSIHAEIGSTHHHE
ncbi:MAG: hypothetical protein GY850_07630 [bacterium]|nr:hypothetical protein [bacterium]